MVLYFVFDSQAGRDKFECVYLKYKNLLWSKAYEILRDPMLAEDAVSEALIRVYKNLHKIDDPLSGRTLAFVVTIVKNTALTLLSQRRSEVVPFEELEAPDPYDWEAAALSDISLEEIYATVDALGEDLKSVFLLKFAYDMSHKEMADVLGITENNVTVRLHRAKKKLSVLLRERGYRHEATE